MRLLILLGFLVFGSQVFALSKGQQYFNVVHQVLSQVPMNEAQHTQMELALKHLKGLVTEEAKAEAAAKDKALRDKIVKEYLEKEGKK